jgi:pyridoxal biosynthesis lyase PdxS
MVASLMADLEAMKHHCAEESEAKHVLTLAKQAAEKPGTGNTVELVRKAQDANDVLRQIKERHDQSVREAEARLQKIMKLVQAGSTKQVEGKSVMILPLGVDQPEGETVEILPLGVDQPKDNSAVIMPLGTEPKDPKEPSEKPKTYQ